MRGNIFNVVVYMRTYIMTVYSQHVFVKIYRMEKRKRSRKESKKWEISELTFEEEK
jgi:hypothetical protein